MNPTLAPSKRQVALDFSEFYREVWGPDAAPFPWQSRLAARVANGDWPSSINIGTGLGKTATADIATWAMLRNPAAHQLVAFVIDRRVVVRAVSERFRRIQAAFPAVQAEELRGDVDIQNLWARDPRQPRLIASTVDQVGSRLFFRGYGVSPNSQPIHAGLMSRALIIADEAHLSVPFLRSLDRAREFGCPIDLVEMTATPTREDGDIFTLDEDDRAHPIISRRLGATKPTRLVNGGNAFDSSMVTEARTILRSWSTPGVLGVIVNRVASAREIARRLDHDGDVVLLTGRMRGLDRETLLTQWVPRIAADEGRPTPTRNIVVVATQAIEVGADLDFDGLVTECAALDALRQRAGRLNRLGRDIEAPAVVVYRKPGKNGDPIYGDALADTWGYLKENAKGLDLNHLPDPPAGLTTPVRESRPIWSRDLDILAKTSGDQQHLPDIAEILHGIGSAPADIRVGWRGDLGTNPDRWQDVVALKPPLAGELMPVPLRAFRRWMSGQAFEICDAEGIVDSGNGGEASDLLALRWRGEDSDTVGSQDDITPGDTLILPVEAGGWNDLGHVLDEEEIDISDSARDARGLPAIVRLAPGMECEIEPGPGERIAISDHPCGGKVATLVRAERRIRKQGVVTLEDHHRDVAAMAGELARYLAPEYQDSIVAAAQWHDAGKSDMRFQAWLHGGSIAAAMTSEPIAKSIINMTFAESRAARARAGLPRGWRHEALSVEMAQKSGVEDELILHLIRSHHGRARDGDAFSHMHRRLGLTAWGLAYIEGILRCADRLVSQQNPATGSGF